MTLLQAFVYYIVRLALYAAVAAGGITIGIRGRRHKNATTNEE